MKRDDELIRSILFEAEDAKLPFLTVLNSLRQSEESLLRRHQFDLLCDAGLMKQQSETAYRLTNKGHDYLAAIRSDTIWNKTKNAAADAGGVTLGMMKDLAIGFLKQEVTSRTGISF